MELNGTLDKYLFLNRMTRTEMAKLLGYTRTYISAVIRRGGIIRRESTAIRLEEITKGFVSRYTTFPELRQKDKARAKQQKKEQNYANGHK